MPSCTEQRPQDSQPYPVKELLKPTLVTAKSLLGDYLRVATDGLNEPSWFRIVETEAYTQDDPACHAYQKRKGRAANLYKAPGTVYVYLIYGMYHCLNFITEEEGRGAAVLIRGIEAIKSPERFKTQGPGRLCKALGITTSEHNGLSALSKDSPIQLWKGPTLNEERIITTTRIGISQAQELPWRFYDKDSRFVSVKIKA